MKPPMPYFGGKITLGPAIASMLPRHRHYVEPFAGSLAVLLAKPLSTMETVNDLDKAVVTFWRVLRERPDELIRVCALTPHSRAEYDAAVDLNAPDELEHLAGYVERMAPVIERLQHVSLECRPALEIIERYGIDDDVLLYVDPPYLGSTRANDNAYRHEMRTEGEHRELAASLRSARASVVLSGYPSDLYDQDLYADWHRIEMPSFTGQGGKWDNRTEVLWSNRPLGEPHLFSEVPA